MVYKAGFVATQAAYERPAMLFFRASIGLRGSTISPDGISWGYADRGRPYGLWPDWRFDAVRGIKCNLRRLVIDHPNLWG